MKRIVVAITWICTMCAAGVVLLVLKEILYLTWLSAYYSYDEEKALEYIKPWLWVGTMSLVIF